MPSMAGTKLGSFFHSAFLAGFPAQLPPRSRAEHLRQGKTEKDFSCFSLGLFPPLPNTPFQGQNRKKEGERNESENPKASS